MKKVPPELDRVIDKILAYRPKPIQKKKQAKRGKKSHKERL